MHLTRRDWFATTFVVVAVVAAALWWAGVGSEGEAAVRVVTAVVLALGFAASASAVVPGFEGLVHGSKLYLVGTSVLGLVALVAGILALVSGHGPMLGALVAATLVLWAISTIRHVRAADRGAMGGPAAVA